MKKSNSNNFSELIESFFKNNKKVIIYGAIVALSILLVVLLLVLGTPKSTVNNTDKNTEVTTGTDIPGDTTTNDTTGVNGNDEKEETTIPDDTTAEEETTASPDTDSQEKDKPQKQPDPNVGNGSATVPSSPLGDDDVDIIEIPSVPQHLQNNYFLQYKEKGINISLTGDVLCCFIFVNEPKSTYSESNKNSVKGILESDCKLLCSSAASYGTTLKIKTAYFTATLNSEIDTNTAGLWTTDACRAIGFKSVWQMTTSLKKQYNVDEVACVFLINRPGRAVAYRSAASSATEFAILYDNISSFKHEFLHLFGAVDYYYPSEIETLTNQLFNNSVMNSGSNIDSFTAFLVGWSDKPDTNSLSFLENTNKITFEYMSDAHSDNAYSGYVENKKLKDGTYTGYLVSGLPEGKGTMKYSSDSYYEGDWLGGLRHGNGSYTTSQGTATGKWEKGSQCGEGTYKYKDGSEYKGSFVNGRFEGKGTMTWADGKYYTGDWKSGSIEGEGTMKYADGSVYEGTFWMERRSGTGKMIYSDGSVYEGSWNSGKRQGNGTMTWSDGSKFTGTWMIDSFSDGTMIYANGDRYEGHFNNGNKFGKGTMYYANGDVYVGDWAYDMREGKGKLTLADGTVYEGYFSDDEFFR